MANTKLPEKLPDVLQVRAFALSLAAELADSPDARTALELIREASCIEEYIWNGRKKDEEPK